MSTRLLYVVDPMCSWCYGFAPVLDSARTKLRDGVSLDLIMGGLAADSDQPMDAQTRAYVQQAWRAVESATGVPFNHDFWSTCKPRRSTYASCRAVIVARQSGQEWQMLKAIQRAYYLEARNPSDASTLIDLAVELGLNADDFAWELNSPKTEALLQADFKQRSRLGASSFPSIAISGGDQEGLLCSGYLQEPALLTLLKGVNTVSDTLS